MTLFKSKLRMDSVKIFLDEQGYYYCKDGSSIKMSILGRFFRVDVGCRTTFINWVKTTEDGDYCSGNATGLEIEGDDIVLTDLYPEIPAELRMTKEQFIKLFDEWLEKVCKTKPKELFIIYENGEYRIEITKE